MPRAYTADEREDLGAPHVRHYIRIEVKDSAGVWQDLQNLGGYNWIKRWEIVQDIDQRVMSGSFTLHRAIGAQSLAPLMTASALNIVGGNYSPLIYAGRLCRFKTLTRGYARLTTALSGANNDLKFRAVQSGPSGDSIQIRYDVPGPSTAFGGIAIVGGTLIVVNLATDGGGAVTTTATDVLIAINASPLSNVLVVASLAPGNSGSGVVTAMAASNLDNNNTYRPMGEGKIDAVDWESSDAEVTCACRDLGALLLDAQIEEENVYGSIGGTAVQTVCQNIIDDYPPPGGATIVVVDDPLWVIGEYLQAKKSVLEACLDLIQQAGFDLRYRYSALDVFQLELYEPDRAKTVADWTLGPSEYSSVENLSVSDADVRNAGRVRFINSATGLPDSVSDVRSSSIAEFGRRYAEIDEDEASNIDTAAEADRLLDAMLDDLAAPKADQEIKTLYFWIAQLGDLGLFSANGVHYDVDQKLAVVKIRHVGENGEICSYLAVRGKPAGANKDWLRRSRTGAEGTQQDGTITLDVEPTAADASTVTVNVYTFAPGSTVRPTVRVAAISFNGSINTGPAVGVDSPSGTTWKFNRVNASGTEYQGIVEFIASLEGYEDQHVFWSIDDKAVVTPTIAVAITQASTTMGYTPTTSNPKSGGSSPTLQFSLSGCTASGYVGSGPFTISSGTAITVNRPDALDAPGTIIFVSTISGQGIATVQRTVPAQDITPKLEIRVEPKVASEAGRLAFTVFLNDPYAGGNVDLAITAESGLDVFDYGTTSGPTDGTLASGAGYDYEAVQPTAGDGAKHALFEISKTGRVNDSRTITVPEAPPATTINRPLIKDLFTAALYAPCDGGGTVEVHWNVQNMPTGAKFYLHWKITAGDFGNPGNEGDANDISTPYTLTPGCGLCSGAAARLSLTAKMDGVAIDVATFEGLI